MAGDFFRNHHFCPAASPIASRESGNAAEHDGKSDQNQVACAQADEHQGQTEILSDEPRKLAAMDPSPKAAKKKIPKAVARIFSVDIGR